MESSANVGDSSKLCVRHALKTKYVCTLNERLTKEHRSVIEKKSFRWFLDLNDNVKLGKNILTELLVRWIDSSGGFCFGDRVVQFKENDFCLRLGLSLDGENIKLKEKHKEAFIHALEEQNL